MKKIIMATAAISTLSLIGCATHSDEVDARYVSPVAYQSYNCDQIAQEETRLRGALATQIEVVDKDASDSNAAVAVGAIIFWPALFWAGQDDAQIAELKQLKGEYEALEKSNIDKQCSTHFTMPEPKPVKKQIPAASSESDPGS